MEEESLPQKILNLTPTGSGKSGRSKGRWKEDVLKAMQECLRHREWEDRVCWRLLVERRHRAFPIDVTKRSAGRAMAQVVSRRPLTTEARVRVQVNPCGICGGQSGTGTGFSPSSSVFPCQYIIPPWLSKLISSGECVIC
jgi:hypothetical protein